MYSFVRNSFLTVLTFVSGGLNGAAAVMRGRIVIRGCLITSKNVCLVTQNR